MKSIHESVIQYIHAERLRGEQASWLYEIGFPDAADALCDRWPSVLMAFNIEAYWNEAPCTVFHVGSNGMFPGGPA